MVEEMSVKEEMAVNSDFPMSKSVSITIALVVSMLTLESCSKDNDSSKDNTAVKAVSFSINDYKVVDDSGTVLTRTSFIDRTDGVTYVWSACDTVGIYPTSGAQIYFPIDGAGGESHADFDGGGWAFKTSAKYYSYYPFIGDIYLDRNKIPVSYVGQRQVGASNNDHVGPYDYMFTPACSSDGGKLNFKYKHLGCILRFNLTALPVGNYTKLAITAPSESFVKSGWFNLQSDSPVIIGKEFTKQLIVDLEEINITDSSTQVYVYLLSAPVQIKGIEVTVSVLNDQKKELQCKKSPPMNFEAQTRYGLKCSEWTEVPQSMGMIIDGWDDGGSLGGDAE